MHFGRTCAHAAFISFYNRLQIKPEGNGLAEATLTLILAALKCIDWLKPLTCETDRTEVHAQG